MRLLLDTHIFIWWDGHLSHLSARARALCEDKNNILLLSLASIWEMQIKSQLGKLTFNQPLPQLIEEQRQANRIELLPITTDHIYSLAELPHHHRDPFDRLLIAQAMSEGIAIVTSDPEFASYNVSLLG